MFLVLARIAHQGSRLSAVRWARDHAVAEVLGLGEFDEKDLYSALDDLCDRQEKIERLFSALLARNDAPPDLFLYDVTSSYLEGECNALGEFGYNRDGKKGKLQIVMGCSPMLPESHWRCAYSAATPATLPPWPNKSRPSPSSSPSKT